MSARGQSPIQRAVVILSEAYRQAFASLNVAERQVLLDILAIWLARDYAAELDAPWEGE